MNVRLLENKKGTFLSHPVSPFPKNNPGQRMYKSTRVNDIPIIGL